MRDASAQSPMDDDEPTTETLRIEQDKREQAEREREQQSAGAEARAAGRRADKAAYLREKLDEQAEHPDEPG